MKNKYLNMADRITADVKVSFEITNPVRQQESQEKGRLRLQGHRKRQLHAVLKDRGDSYATDKEELEGLEHEA